MIKKDVLARVIVISIITGAASVHAATIGSYAGFQLGYGNTKQISLSESDVVPDYNLTVGAMPSTNDVASFTSKTSDKSTIARFFLGYQFYTNMGIEMGAAKYHNSTLSYESTLANADTVNRRDNIQEYTIDLMIKGSMPVSNVFDLYAKLGGAMVFTKTQKQISVVDVTGSAVRDFSYAKDIKRSSFSPGFAIGAAYYFTPDMGADLSYNRIITHFGNNDNISYTAIGMIYNIGSA